MFKNMTIKTRTTFLFAASLIIFTGLSVVSYLNLNSISLIFKRMAPAIEIIKNDSDLNSLAQFIRYYDEILTQSARNYAFTGDGKWKERYQEFAPRLSDKIQMALKIGSESDRKIFDGINAANNALVEMEKGAIEKTDQGKKSEALKILQSKEYDDQKNIYQNGLQEFAKSRGERYENALSVQTEALSAYDGELNKDIKISLAITAIKFIILIFVAVAVFLIIRETVINPINKFQSAIKEISENNFDVAIALKRRDELGQLAESFNKMAAALKELYGRLEEKVRTRVSELNEKVTIIEDKNRNLEETRLAMTNLLEDLNLEKNRVITENARDEAFLAAIGEGLVIVNNGGKIEFTNSVFENLTGYKKDEILGKFFADVWKMTDESGNPLPKEKRPIELALKENKIIKIGEIDNYYYVRKDGSKFPVLLTAAPISTPKEIIGVVNVFRDVTEEKRIDRAKSEFVSLASHQLRTPLTIIKWYAEMLLGDDSKNLTKSQKKYSQEIYDGARRMAELITAILSVSRIELGTFAIELQEVDVAEIAEDLAKNLAPSFAAKKIAFEKNFEPGLPKVQTDPNAIRITLDNLLSNAINYAPENGKIGLEINRRNSEIAIKVSDNGLGIPLDEQSKIFNRFFRAANAKSKVPQGTGLGLYIVKTLLEKTGGKIRFESKGENSGTTFFVTLPIKNSK